MTTPRVTVADLRPYEGHGPHPFLLCDHCGAEYSANRPDYWNEPVGRVFRCCRRNMRLVTQETRVVDLRGRA